jgi:beta-lactamase superfamily II metal-dependent hydrolase
MNGRCFLRRCFSIKRRNTFFKHYGSLLNEVVTLTLPHHGSDHNFDAALPDRIQPSFCAASADRLSSWRHPGTAVVQSVASTGRLLSVVTSNAESEVTETVVVVE